MDPLQLITTVGVPTAMLLICGGAVWKVLIWLGANVATPLVANHLEFLKTSTATTTKQTELMEKMVDSQVALGIRLDDLCRKLRPPPGKP